jgi:hypothetical protein
MIRVTASLVHKSGTEILRHDSRPMAPAGLRAAVEDAIDWLCDEGGYTVEEGHCRVVLRIERVIGMSAPTIPRLVTSHTET